MTKLSDELIGNIISLVCFGEHVGFIHIGDKSHCRIESEAVVVGVDGNERALFPEPARDVLPLILGAKVSSVTVDTVFTLAVDNGSLISVTLTPGYESVMLTVNAQYEVH